MRAAVGLTECLGLDGDRCIRVIPRQNVMLSMSKTSKIDQVHLRAVMLCMSKMSKMGKEHTHTFLFITFLIFN